MISTFLFDLDGTLLPLDLDKFIKLYLEEMAIKLKDHIPFEKTAKYVWESTDFMVNNTDMQVTNMGAFLQHFTKLTKISFEELSPIFEDFYLKEFLKTKEATSPNPIVREIIEILKQKNYDLVVATNPLFPRRAILHRLEWAGLDQEDFKLITSYETMHACKPYLRYYKEILDIIGKEPEECMMVGNDVQEDMVASKIGMTTFLLEDQIIHRENTIPICDYKGSYDDLKNIILSKF